MTSHGKPVYPGILASRLHRLEFAALPTELGGNNPATGLMPSFLVRFMTINGTVSDVLDTGYQPPLGHAASLIVQQYSVTDVVHNVAKSGHATGLVKQLIAGPGIVNQTWTQDAADGALTTAVPSFSIIEPSGDLGLIFTPPVGYSGNLEWCLLLYILEN